MHSGRSVAVRHADARKQRLASDLKLLHAGYPQSHQILPQHEQHLDGVPGNYGMGSGISGHGHVLGNYSALTSSNGLSLDRWRLVGASPCLI